MSKRRRKKRHKCRVIGDFVMPEKLDQYLIRLKGGQGLFVKHGKHPEIKRLGGAPKPPVRGACSS
mgnify:CR=1 FL=1